MMILIYLTRKKKHWGLNKYNQQKLITEVLSKNNLRRRRRISLKLLTTILKWKRSLKGNQGS
jgi:hypothetical protein